MESLNWDERWYDGRGDDLVEGYCIRFVDVYSCHISLVLLLLTKCTLRDFNLYL